MRDLHIQSLKENIANVCFSGLWQEGPVENNVNVCFLGLWQEGPVVNNANVCFSGLWQEGQDVVGQQSRVWKNMIPPIKIIKQNK